MTQIQINGTTKCLYRHPFILMDVLVINFVYPNRLFRIAATIYMYVRKILQFQQISQKFEYSLEISMRLKISQIQLIYNQKGRPVKEIFNLCDAYFKIGPSQKANRNLQMHLSKIGRKNNHIL